MKGPKQTSGALDGMIVEIELTLVSIIQGVALTMLIESAHEVVGEMHLVFWPYVFSGLLIILVFWSRAVLHILTLIRWPIELGHNFLYVGCALIEAILFAQLAQPGHWFSFGAAFMAAGWLLFVYDLRLIHTRMEDSAGVASNRLFALVRRDQWLNIALLVPGVFALNAGSAMAIHAWPEFFIERNGHVWLVAVQLAGFIGYLLYVVRFFATVAPLVAHARAEWREASKTESVDQQ